jgi:hypothetical protein
MSESGTEERKPVSKHFIVKKRNIKTGDTDS